MIMENYRLRPKSNYLHEASIADLYTLSEKWLSDIEFYKLELIFLQKLVKEHFILLTKDQKSDMINALLKKIKNEIDRYTDLKSDIKAQLKKVTLLMENPFSMDEQVFRDEHLELENNIVNFKTGEQILKSYVFENIEKIMHSVQLPQAKN